MSRIYRLTDRFVEKVNSSPREPLPPWDIPEALWIGAPDGHGYYDWQIQRTEAIDWITPYEEKLPARLPPSFRSLVTRYTYPAFEAGPFWFFANVNSEAQDELLSAVFRDKALTTGLLNNGYIQFARPSGGSYDPICFDAKRKSGTGEYPIIWIDHEGILCDDRICVVEEVADSFSEFIEGYLQLA